MSGENVELRYLVKASEELADDVKREIVEVLLEEGDMVSTVSSIYDEIESSNRTVRNHIAESDLLEREQSQGVSLVYVVDEMGEKALSVCESCMRANDQNGLPEFDEWAERKRKESEYNSNEGDAL